MTSHGFLGRQHIARAFARRHSSPCESSFQSCTFPDVSRTRRGVPLSTPRCASVYPAAVSKNPLPSRARIGRRSARCTGRVLSCVEGAARCTGRCAGRFTLLRGGGAAAPARPQGGGRPRLPTVPRSEPPPARPPPGLQDALPAAGAVRLRDHPHRGPARRRPRPGPEAQPEGHRPRQRSAPEVERRWQRHRQMTATTTTKDLRPKRASVRSGTRARV